MLSSKIFVSTSVETLLWQCCSVNISHEGEMGIFADCNFYKKCFVVTIVILFVVSAFLYIFSNNFRLQNVKNLNSIVYSKQATRHKVNNVQRRRLSLVTSVCNKYRNDSKHKYLYVDKPGSKVWGKFTFEPKAKLTLCNIMKQGQIFMVCYFDSIKKSL